MAAAAILEKLQMALYSAHRAVVFAIAQLSCFSLGVVFTLTSKNLPCPVMLVLPLKHYSKICFPSGPFSSRCGSPQLKHILIILLKKNSLPVPVDEIKLVFERCFFYIN